MGKPLDSLLQREMTRKEFLSVLGLGITSILGFSSVWRLFFAKHDAPATNAKDYGAKPYGGKD